ncbi:esterase [Mycobacterium saskatchewanense]|uniref:Esterase n=2 Tax=Mycobacterium saskatchewanense TaxID=220927 RepID=A0AAJ3NPT8_9MYCO|nr:alpha/beta hydrolase fold domain-containing protein [Mycobacterium saskatchewanense]ORW71126.1 esterase [Mycobacterium saskatchewanense]BBX62699.1 esterase [Mycobacterium saskatchewanense]
MGDVLDPELAAAVAALPTMDLSDLAAARESGQLLFAQPKYHAGIPLTVCDVAVNRSRGAAKIPVRIYASDQRSTPAPVLVYLHGCSYVMGGLAMADFTARLLVEWADVSVVTVDYRLAPEDPYPAGLEDGYAVLCWVADNGLEFGLDAGSVGLLGEGVGGGLAAALALLARDRGGPRLAAQFLDAPLVDDRLQTPSMKTLVDTPMWRPVDYSLGWRHYLKGIAQPGGADVPIYAAPARASVQELVGLPRAFVTTYQIDPTRDEGLRYANRLMQAGVPTDLEHYAGAFHIAHAIPGTTIGLRMISDRVKAIRRMLVA